MTSYSTSYSPTTTITSNHSYLHQRPSSTTTSDNRYYQRTSIRSKYIDSHPSRYAFAMANAIINTGALVAFAISLSSGINGATNVDTSTSVEIGAGVKADGEGGDLGGAVPAISIWNEQGSRLGQYMPDKGYKIGAGTSNAKPISISQDQGASGQPEYVQLTMVNDDAMCITYVTVAGNGVSWTWMGDMGYTCGGDWYPSKAKFGTDNYQPRCAWLDANHSDDLRFIAMSMHMPDFNGDSALIDEYNENTDNLCNSKARFMQWGELQVNPGYNQIPPMFNPPLEYNADGSDKDFDALFKPGRVNDKRSIPVINDVPVPTHNMTGRINRPGHVVISDYKAHHASEVCGSETSRGPSFVSTQDGTYCDMSTKTHWPLCSEDGKTGCFDMDTNEVIKPFTRRHARNLEVREVHKRYGTSERWTPEE